MQFLHMQLYEPNYNVTLNFLHELCVGMILMLTWRTSP